MNARDFALYVGCPCLIFDSDDPEIGVPDTVEGVDIVSNTVFAERTNYAPEQVRLVLKPLSSLTPEDVAALAGRSFFEGVFMLAQAGYDMTGLLARGLAVPESEAPSPHR